MSYASRQPSDASTPDIKLSSDSSTPKAEITVCLKIVSCIMRSVYKLRVGWIAPVSGDVHKARCLYCRAMVRAHYKDLKVHARTAKHAHNVVVNQPGCIADPQTPAAKPLLNRRRTFGPQRTTRFGIYRCQRSLLATETSVSCFTFTFIIMRPSSLGGGRILRCTLSVRLSIRPVIERHVAPRSELQ